VGSLERKLGRYQGPAGVILDPPSLGKAPRHRPVFDPAPHRNRDIAPAPAASPGMMNRMIAMCVQFGMPRHLAEEARTNPYGPRHSVYFLAGLLFDAAAGNREARNALDRIREGLVNAGAVAETFSAVEQPADAAELTRLMGGD